MLDVDVRCAVCVASAVGGRCAAVAGGGENRPGHFYSKL